MTTTQNLFCPNFKHVPSEAFRGGPQVSVSLWVTGDRDSGHLRLLPLKPILKSYNAPFESVPSPDSPNTWLWKLLNCCVCVSSLGEKGICQRQRLADGSLKGLYGTERINLLGNM
ncbi:unnamed protein product [Arctogadus glacialis]